MAVIVGIKEIAVKAQKALSANEEFAKLFEGNKTLANSVVESTIDAMVAALLADEGVRIPKLGYFKIKDKKERVSTNPATHKKMVIPAHRTLTLKVCKELKKLPVA